MAQASSQKSLSKKSSRQMPQHPWWLDSWKPYCWLALLSLVVYGKTLQHALVDFDDMILAFLPDVLDHSLWKIFVPTTDGNLGFYRPMYFLLLYFTDTLFSGNQQVGLHLLSLASHIAAGCAVFLALGALRFSRGLAFVLAAVMLAHPLLAMAVSWVPGSNDSLLMATSAAALYAFVRFVETRATKFFVWHSVWTLGMVLTKESAIAVPLLFALYGVLFTQSAFGQSAQRTALGEHQADDKNADDEKSSEKLSESFSVRHWAMLVGMWLVVCGKAAYLASLNTSLAASFRLHPPQYGFAALAHTWRTLPELAGKMIVPFYLSVYPSFSDVATFLGGVIAVAAIAGIGHVAYRTGTDVRSEAVRVEAAKRWAFGAAWFVVLLLPPMLVALRTGNTVEYDYLEHRAYLPMFGVLVMLGVLWQTLARQESAKSSAKNVSATAQQVRSFSPYIAGAVILVFGVMSFFRANDFRDRESFWKAAAEQSPQATAEIYAMLGMKLYFLNDNDGAEYYFNRTLSLKPKEPSALNGRALLLLDQGRLREAEIALNQAYAADSNSADVLYTMAKLMITAKPDGFLGKAAEYSRRAIRRNPEHTQAYSLLVALLTAQGNTAEVQQTYATAQTNGLDPTEIRERANQFLGKPTPRGQ